MASWLLDAENVVDVAVTEFSEEDVAVATDVKEDDRNVLLRLFFGVPRGRRGKLPSRSPSMLLFLIPLEFRFKPKRRDIILK